MLIGLRSRRQIAPFTMECPTSVRQALALHDKSGVSVFMAGGMDLIDWLKYGHPVDHVIRLDGIAELASISSGPDGLHIGAMTTHDALIRDASIAAALPDLPGLWQGVANPRVRFAGTIGGNVMAGKPEYDALPALLALGAEAEIADPTGPRRTPLDTPITALLTGFHVPAAQRLFADRSLRPAISVWCGLTIAQGVVRSIRVAVGAAHKRPVCVALQPEVPLHALPEQADALAERITAALPEPVSDANASAGYRRRMAGVLTRRLLIRAGAST